ncbi:MAG: hypothetical protein KDA62_10395 [Planctomycetales bacterium]|nr:hypothetical protein [Planctomycetales bacterium]
MKIGRLFYKSGATWTDVPATLYVLKGDSIIFGVEADPHANWPAGKPVWSDGVPDVGILLWPLFPYLKFQKVTFDTVGDKVISVECGNTKSVTVKVAELVVRFDPGEARPGIGDSRKAKVKVKAMRTAAGADVTINLAVDNARATVAPASFVLPAADMEKEQEITLTGVTLSAANRDTTLNASVGGTVIGTLPVTVVKPKKYSITGSQASSPWTLKPGSTTVIIWNTPVLITVKDQFDVVLTKAFEGAHVQEEVKIPGAAAYGNRVGLDEELQPQNWSPLSAVGTVYDMVRGVADFMNADIAGKIANGTLLYPKDFGLVSPNVNGPFFLKFFVDGEELDGVTRRMRIIEDNKETVTNTIQ